MLKRLSALAVSVIIFCNLLTSCAHIENIYDEDQTSEQTTTVSTPEPEITTTPDPNVPSNVISKAPDTSASESEAPITSSSEVDVPASSETTTEVSEQTEATTSSNVELPDVTTASTNEEGKVVDDYKSNIEFNTEDPDELYEMFGLDRNERRNYYSEISGEHDFPIVHISTEDEQHILSNEEYVNCLVEIFNCDEKYVLDATSAGVKVRGNASSYYGKESKLKTLPTPYRIKFTERQSVLGLNSGARCKSWVLLRSFSTGVRDYMAYDIARAINEGDYYTSDAQFVQLYVNEVYRGLFVLCEQTQEQQYRVDINECEPDYEGTDIGYLVELDNYGYGEEYRFLLNYNKEEITDVNGETRVPVKYYYSVKNDLYSEEQLKFIERYFEVCYEISLRAIRDGEFYKVNENYELVLAQEEFLSAYECISRVIDVNSFVCMYMTHEITNNLDLGSFFFAVDFGEHSRYPVLTCVAPWDFDWGYSDYSRDPDGGIYAATFKDEYFIEDLDLGDRTNPWLVLFYSADWFRDLVKEKWAQRYDALLDVINETTDLVNDHRDDFNDDQFDTSSKASRANSTIKWTTERLEYLNELWG